MGDISKAIEALRRGDFVLIHDRDSRENETDFVVAAQNIGPNHILRMRRDGGGLICAAVAGEIATRLGLPFLDDVGRFSSTEYPILRYLNPSDIPYDEKSSFSVSVNHRSTFTGVTDRDRALTVRELAEFCSRLPQNAPKEFGRLFRSPGHVFLLRSSGLENREGHTELSVALLKMAKLTPIAAICEMMDSTNHNALSGEGAREYAKEHDLIFLETNEIKEGYMEWLKSG